MNPTPLCARIFRLQGRIFPNRLTGVIHAPLLVCSRSPQQRLSTDRTSSVPARMFLRQPLISAAPARDPCGKHHLANMLHDLALRRIVECTAVDKSVRDSPWSCPSTDHSRRVPVSHVDMKVLVAGYLEKHDFAGVRHRPVRPEASDDRFHGFHPRRPRVADVNVSCGDRRRAGAAAVLRGGIRRLVRTVFHGQLWTHAFTPCVL